MAHNTFPAKRRSGAQRRRIVTTQQTIRVTPPRSRVPRTPRSSNIPQSKKYKIT